MLLIDNYDSFTYNLVDLVFQATGQQIKVVRNDELTIAQIAELKPKAIIISPGPKDPDHAGISLSAIDYAAKTSTKLFGICLGHQAIGQYFGGKIIRAPKPGHGKVHEIYISRHPAAEALPRSISASQAIRTQEPQGTLKRVQGDYVDHLNSELGIRTPLRHPEFISGSQAAGTQEPKGTLNQVQGDYRGGGILAGLPQSFKATRYHSLVIDPATIPDCLNIDAVSCDGQIMAISHKTLPIFGVQFHPESILSEFGKEMMNNFCEI